MANARLKSMKKASEQLCHHLRYSLSYTGAGGIARSVDVFTPNLHVASRNQTETCGVLSSDSCAVSQLSMNLGLDTTICDLRFRCSRENWQDPLSKARSAECILRVGFRFHADTPRGCCAYYIL